MRYILSICFFSICVCISQAFHGFKIFYTYLKVILEFVIMKNYILVVVGLPGVGKTYISNRLTKILGVEHIDEDSIKHNLVPTLLGREKYEWHVKEQVHFPPEIRKKGLFGGF